MYGFIGEKQTSEKIFIVTSLDLLIFDENLNLLKEFESAFKETISG